MDPLTSKKFSFSSATLGKDTFEVVSFTGSEGLSKLYRFEITLVSDNAELDMENVIHARATLTLLRAAGNIDFHGILVSFEQMLYVNGRSTYRAVLAPLFWRHTLTHHNQVFLSKTAQQIIESALKDGGLTSLDYEFRLSKVYPEREYVCMYNESHYSFVTRWMEREGIYYYFEQEKDNEKLIITDSSLTHSTMLEGEKMIFSPVSGLDEISREEVIKTIVCFQKALPARVMLKDYNYRKPSLELSAVHQVSERGIGDVYIYGEHFSTPEEGAHLAQIRAEELKCRAKLFHGESLIPYLRPGYTFLLSEHFRKDLNVRYLTTDIEHSGSQSFYFNSGLSQTLSEREKAPYYRNTFTAILSSGQFRPERVAEKPRISGTINANIDAEGSGEYAELDNQGRYKVHLPFDLSESKGGKASSWLRMAQPYAGSDHGMHFPLHKDTEVLLTFIDGDPDRPVIAAAVTNPLTPSPVTGENQTTNIIRSAADNRMEMEDEDGSERVRFSTPHLNSSLHLGAPVMPGFGAGSVGAAAWSNTDEGFEVVLTTDGSGKLHTGEKLIVEADTFMENKIGNLQTPLTTPTFIGITWGTPPLLVEGTVALPATGDYYLTTSARQVHNVGSDMVIQVAGNYSEIITGTKSVHILDNAFEAIDKDFKQVIKGTLNQTVNGSVTKVTKVDVQEDVMGDHCVNVTGTGKHTYGSKENRFYGASSDIFMGAFDAVYVGVRLQIHTGSNNMVNVLNNNTINIGLLMSITMGLKLDMEYISIKSKKLDTKMINTKIADYKAAKIEKATLKVEKTSTVDVADALLTMVM